MFRLCPEALKSKSSVDTVINDFFVSHERMPDAGDVGAMLASLNGLRSTAMSLVCFRNHVTRSTSLVCVIISFTLLSHLQAPHVHVYNCF